MKTKGEGESPVGKQLYVKGNVQKTVKRKALREEKRKGESSKGELRAEDNMREKGRALWDGSST